MPTGFVDYKKRAFCNSICCPVQLELNAKKEGTVEYEEIRKKCADGCMKSADHFRSWLADHDFQIIDEKANQIDERNLDEIAHADNTAWRFHRKITQLGMLVAKPE